MPNTRFPRSIYLLPFIMLLPACHFMRAIVFFGPDIYDKDHLPKTIISRSPKTLPFGFKADGLSKAKKAFLAEQLPNSNTHAFVVIQDDTIIYEYYSRKHDKSSLFLGFSLSKSFVATVLGIAVDEGFIKSTNDPVIKYIPEFKGADKSLQDVTIQQLLDMRAGLAVDETGIGPNGYMSRLYYGNHINAEILKLKAADSSRFKYTNTNTQLLLMIIERATGQKFQDYFRDKLWHRIGAEYDAHWIIDGHKHQTPKAFYGMIATPYDFAKIGRLYIHQGQLNGQRVISRNWIHASCDMDSLYKYRYKNHWWGNNDDHYFTSDSLAGLYLVEQQIKGPIQCFGPNKYCVSRKGDSFIGEGIKGQFIYVNPGKKLIIVRFGDENPENKPDMGDVITTLGNAF